MPLFSHLVFLILYELHSRQRKNFKNKVFNNTVFSVVFQWLSHVVSGKNIINNAMCHANVKLSKGSTVYYFILLVK